MPAPIIEPMPRNVAPRVVNFPARSKDGAGTGSSGIRDSLTDRSWVDLDGLDGRDDSVSDFFASPKSITHFGS